MLASVCVQVAKAYGIGLDPIYSLAAWEAAVAAAAEDEAAAPGQAPRVVMLHCGGGLGLHGLAQRMPESF